MLEEVTTIFDMIFDMITDRFYLSQLIKDISEYRDFWPRLHDLRER